MSCMSGSPNLNSFRDRGQVAVQLVSCGVLLPGLVQDNKFYVVFKPHYTKLEVIALNFNLPLLQFSDIS